MNNFGKYGEDRAVQYMESLGYRILDRNYSCFIGEIDVIAGYEDLIIFTEVKYRASDDYGDPSEFVFPSKIKRIIRTAEVYIKERNLFHLQPRFDVCSVYKGGHVEYYDNAFP